MLLLDQIKIASPCSADWGAMTGTDQARFCGQCRKNVYNLSAMTLEEAQRVVAEHEGHLCVRFYTRADGTMLTRDCPVGLRAVRYRRIKKFSYAAAFLISCGVGLTRGASAVTTMQKHARPVTKIPARTQGKMMKPGVGPDPFAFPGGGGHTMGGVGRPIAVTPTMGKLVMGTPESPK